MNNEFGDVKFEVNDSGLDVESIEDPVTKAMVSIFGFKAVAGASSIVNQANLTPELQGGDSGYQVFRYGMYIGPISGAFVAVLYDIKSQRKRFVEQYPNLSMNFQDYDCDEILRMAALGGIAGFVGGALVGSVKGSLY